MKYILMLLATLSMTAHATAQNTTVAWKKEVARVITLKENAGPGKPHTQKKALHDSTLLEMIVAAGMSGKVTLYSNSDYKFSTPLSPDELKNIFYAPPDTNTVIDPISRKERTHIVYRDFDFEAVNRFRFLENWTFDPQTGETHVHIDGIAPIKDVYIDAYTASQQAAFWVHYADIAGIIARFERKHPNSSLTRRLWADYFWPEKNVPDGPEGDNLFQRKISRRYDLDPEDTGNGRLKNMEEDTSLYNKLFHSVLAGRTPATDSTGNEWHFFDTPDTTVIYDPIAQKEEMKIVQHYPILDHHARYRIDEEWSFNKMSGDMIIKTAAVIPFSPNTNPIDNSPAYWYIFWLKYQDIFPLLSRYELAHPGMSLALNLWRDRLYTGKK